MSEIRINQWKQIKTKDEIMHLDLKKDVDFLLPRFKNALQFGTAGIRGIMGAGTDRMNVHTISAASLAYAKYLIANVKDAKKRGIVIGHDNRHNSKLFTETAARVIMQEGIRVYIYANNEMQPTPLISYTIRKLNLAGGAIFTASHNPKEYNGFKVYNALGGQLMPSETKKVQEIMKDINPIAINKSNKKISKIKESIIDNYIKEILKKVQIRSNDQKTLKVVFTPQHGTSNKIGPEILGRMNISYKTVEKQMIEDPDFSNTKTPNPEDGRSLVEAIKIARKNKSDIAITTDPDADRFGLAVKYKRRFKYLNGNQIAALYLDYYLNEMDKKNKVPKNGYIITSNVSGDLAKRIAERYGIKVYETHVGFKNMADLIESKNGKNEKFIMAYEESYGFLLNETIARDKDSFQAIAGVIEMANYYKTQDMNLFSKLKNLYLAYGVHRTITSSTKLTEGQATTLMNNIKKTKELDGKKCIQIEDYRKSELNGLPKAKLIKLTFDDGSWFAIRPSGTEPKVKIYVQSVGQNTDKLIDVIDFEKHVSNSVYDNSETLTVKGFSWKTVFKYTIFTTIIVAIMFIVFNYVYDTGKSGNVFENAKKIIDGQNNGIFLMMWAFWIIYQTNGAIIRYKMIKYTGGYVRLRDLQIASIMGGVISYVTPFAIGGDAIVYWYLRRKGAERGPLISSLMSATTIYQANTVIETIVLMSIGWPVYKYILFNANSPEQYALVAMFLGGLAWNLFSAIMIITLTTFKRFQEFIVTNSIKLLEWTPFIPIADPDKISAQYLFELRQMRMGMYKLWNNKKFMGQIMLLQFWPTLISGGSLIMVISGWVRGDIANPYITQIIGSDVVRTANSLAITPGGSGTGEFLNQVVNDLIYKSEYKGLVFESSSVVASSWNVVNKIVTGWPLLLTSTFSVINVLIGENLLEKHRIRIKNKNLTKSNAEIKSFTFYKHSIIIWAFIFTGFFTFLMLF